MTEEQGIVRYTVRPGEQEKFRPLLSQFVDAVRQEPGNLRFDAYQDLEDSRKFVVLGRYVSHEAVIAHRESEHFRRILTQQIVPLLEHREIEGFPVVKPSETTPLEPGAPS